jgi:hypothetical protein
MYSGALMIMLTGLHAQLVFHLCCLPLFLKMPSPYGCRQGIEPQIVDDDLVGSGTV